MKAVDYLLAVTEALAAADEAYHLRIELRATIRTDAPPQWSSVLTDTALGDIADLEMGGQDGAWTVLGVEPRAQVPWAVAKSLLAAIDQPAQRVNGQGPPPWPDRPTTIPDR